MSEYDSLSHLRYWNNKLLAETRPDNIRFMAIVFVASSQLMTDERLVSDHVDLNMLEMYCSRHIVNQLIIMHCTSNSHNSIEKQQNIS